MSRVARKRFFGVHAPDLPACVHVDTETNTCLFILDWVSLEIFQSVQENFQSGYQRNIGPDPAMYLQSLSAPFGIYKNNIFWGWGLYIAKGELDSAFPQLW